MAQEVRHFAVTIPAGTLKTAPVTSDVSFPPRVVTSITWRVPPGPSGLMGWQLTMAGNPVIPHERATYVVADNQGETWDVTGYPDSGAWQITAYNTDIYDHTVYLTFLLDMPAPAAAATSPALATAAALAPPSQTSPGQPPPVVIT